MKSILLQMEKEFLLSKMSYLSLRDGFIKSKVTTKKWNTEE